MATQRPRPPGADTVSSNTSIVPANLAAPPPHPQHTLVLALSPGRSQGLALWQRATWFLSIIMLPCTDCPPCATRLAGPMSPASVPPLPLQHLPQHLHPWPSPPIPWTVQLHPWERFCKHPPPPPLHHLRPRVLWPARPVDQVPERVLAVPLSPSHSPSPPHVAD